MAEGGDAAAEDHRDGADLDHVEEAGLQEPEREVAAAEHPDAPADATTPSGRSSTGRPVATVQGQRP